MDIPSSSDWAIKCQNDGEFCLAARYWNGGINLEIGDQRISIQVNEGSVADGEALQGALTFKGSEDFWAKMLSPIPPRFFNEMFASLNTGQDVERTGDQHRSVLELEGDLMVRVRVRVRVRQMTPNCA